MMRGLNRCNVWIDLKRREDKCVRKIKQRWGSWAGERE